MEGVATSMSKRKGNGMGRIERKGDGEEKEETDNMERGRGREGGLGNPHLPFISFLSFVVGK